MAKITKKYPTEQTIEWYNTIAYAPESSVKLLLSFQSEEDDQDDDTPQIGFYDSQSDKFYTMKGDEIDN